MDRLQPLFELAVVLILASHSNGETWGVTVNKSITAVIGQRLIIPCTFSYPREYHTENLQLFWKLRQKSTFNTHDRDGNAFIYHPNDTFVVAKYQGKTRMPRESNKSCTLRITNLMDSQLVIYLRIIAKENFSFYRQSVTISASGTGVVPVTLNPEMIFPTSAMPSDLQHLMNREMLQTIYLAIFVPLAAAGILLAAGFLIWKKHTRSQSFVREGSGYYANFSRASPNQATRKEISKKDNKTLPDKKVTEEPIYINVQHAAGQTDAQGGDHNIYENVTRAK